jgi:aminopeptidase
MLQHARPFHLATAAVVLLAAIPLSAQSRDHKAVAHNLVAAAMIKPGDKVMITGSVRDAGLMEDIAIETMKAGGQPLIALGSETLTKRSFTEVPASYDSQSPTLSMAIINAFDVQISIDVGETEGLLASVPVRRLAARAKAAEPATALFVKKGMRTVNFGNGLYPTGTLARRLGVAEPQLADVFWRASSVPASSLRSRAEKLRSSFATGKQVTITHANGTHISFAVDNSHAIISDGALTPEKVKQGGVAASTYLPAGELLFPAVPGSANGKVVIDRFLWNGKIIRGLTLNFSGGRLTSMTAASGLEPLKAAYDAAGGAKDSFGGIDIGVNPETKAPLGTGWMVWSAPGSVSFEVGDNRGFGGTTVSDFDLVAQLGGATVNIDGKPVITKGVIR